MQPQSILPLITSVIALVFTIGTARQYLERRKTHQLVWTIALLMFAVAAFMEFYSEIAGWNVPMYQWYYVLSASLVGFLGAGTVFLLSNRTVAYGYLGFVTVLTLIMLFKSLNAAIMTDAFVPGITVAGKAMPGDVRVFSPFLSGTGTLALVGGALLSWFKTKRTYNLFIAVGPLIIAVVGALARFGMTNYLYLGEMVGLTLLYIGFIKSQEVLRPINPARVGR